MSDQQIPTRAKQKQGAFRAIVRNPTQIQLEDQEYPGLNPFDVNIAILNNIQTFVSYIYDNCITSCTLYASNPVTNDIK